MYGGIGSLCFNVKGHACECRIWMFAVLVSECSKLLYLRLIFRVAHGFSESEAAHVREPLNLGSLYANMTY